MEMINHFSHEHPLKLVDWEMILSIIGVDGSDDEGKSGGAAVGCYICEEPLSNGDSAYACSQCRFFVHKLCSQLPDTVNLPSLYQHPLKITMFKNKDIGVVFCYVCRQRVTRGFIYGINEKDDKGQFQACSNCSLAAFARKAEADAIKEEAKIKIEHKSHPQHPLTLRLRPASFQCDACKTEERDLFYECDTCDFWIHKSCATLAPTIYLPHHHPKHPLVLVYSLPEKFYRYPYYCKFCNKYVHRDGWLYHCGNCRFFTHIKCALKAETTSTSRDDPSTLAASDDVHSLVHFPMSEAFTDPLKLLHSEIIAQDDKETTEINHWSHLAHPLALNVEDPQGNNMMPDINSGDPIRSRQHICIQMQNELQVLLLRKLCFLPKTIKHESHNHPLTQIIDPTVLCNACNRLYPGISYACKACDFQLCMDCAMRSPQSLAHRYCKGHEIPLTYPPVEDHPEDFYCDICEEEMDPKLPLYHCHTHKSRSSFHLDCISRKDYYANVWYEGTGIQAYHKHPLTFVRRKKTPKYVCSVCNQDINGFLVLECRARVCNFNICCDCHLNKE